MKIGVVKKYPNHCIATKYINKKIIIISTIFGEYITRLVSLFFDLNIRIMLITNSMVIQIRGISEGLVTTKVVGISNKIV